MKNGNKVVGIVDTHEDVCDTYETNHITNYLKTEENKSEVKVQIQN